MKINDFKSRFLEITFSQKKETISALKAALNDGSYLKPVKPKDVESVKKSFPELIQWCESKTYSPQLKS